MALSCTQINNTAVYVINITTVITAYRTLTPTIDVFVGARMCACVSPCEAHAHGTSVVNMSRSKPCMPRAAVPARHCLLPLPPIRYSSVNCGTCNNQLIHEVKHAGECPWVAGLQKYSNTIKLSSLYYPVSTNYYVQAACLVAFYSQTHLLCKCYCKMTHLILMHDHGSESDCTVIALSCII